MRIESFPDIENFQKLPKQVIVKGGEISIDESKGLELGGIVLNNVGHAIRNIRVHLILFDSRNIPLFKRTLTPKPDAVEQGGISTFLFQTDEVDEKNPTYYLYADWKFDERS